jgi:hypothetical protein
MRKCVTDALWCLALTDGCSNNSTVHRRLGVNGVLIQNIIHALILFPVYAEPVGKLGKGSRIQN